MRAIYLLIPLVSIIGGLAVGAIAILTEHRRKQAILEERRLMIEKGMTPPPLDAAVLERERPAGTQASVESSLRTGVITLFVGLGLIGAFLVMRYLGFADSFFPPRVVALLGPAGVLVALIGLGNLVYFWVARDRARIGGA
jgi:hypothetical protein